ncbi:S-layer homology domain-containing protein [Chamaesiphon sp. GL140_3_metabinner_50]|uniref:S-layer homology domain-containing protein n=1 Tax=Chamaesiphon sp. GL140_3_metabinner_50 TaxID=2970812 RepID=UPI0025EBDD58|nr:S-layer homology domain-containing protein [Chamaesiphon sp. GL140_3_metabinner_50]
MNRHYSLLNFKRITLFLALMSATIVTTAARVVAIPTNPLPASSIAQATPPPPPQPTQPSTSNLSDISSSWAEPFIKILADKNIIVGYPDGTYRPDQPITRAEFAAMLNKAFDLQPIRESRTFADVPSNYWAASVIDRAYRAGFLAGHHNNTFGPNKNIVRIESLVALVNGSKIQPDGSTASRVDELFTDAAQIPSYGRNAIVAATQKCVAVSVSYPDSRTYDPNRIATRADVAASLHQILVAAGRLPALAADNPAQKYIVSCGTAPSVAKITEADILNRTSIGTAPGIVVSSGRKPLNAPAGGITTPTAFGANWGDIFAGAGYQDNLPIAIAPNGSDNNTVYGGGIGLGNSKTFVGLETSYTSAGTSLAQRGGFNFKLHKQLGDNLSIAAGWENAIRNGYTTANDPKDTYYGAITGILPVGATSNFTATVGAGSGRFRTFNDLTADNKNVNIFGSLGFRFSENIAVAADYNGRNFSVGLPLTVKLGDTIGLQVTPALLDIAGDQNTGPKSRFALGGGIGIHF